MTTGRSTRHTRRRHHHGNGVPVYLPANFNGDRAPAPAPEVRLRVNLLGFERACHLVRSAGGRFITLTLTTSPEPAVVAAFALRGDLVVVTAPAGRSERIVYGSLGDDWPATRWAEQELVERHPQVQPVDYRPEPELTRPDPDRLGTHLRGEDLFALPFGPVRSGIFESIQFLIETGGEDVPELRTRPFFKHRGMESRFVGLDPVTAAHVAERVAGIASVAYACAFSQAVERALGIEPPTSADRWRALHAELERLACHLDVIAKEAETTALSVGHARFAILKERIMRLRVALSGSRFGRGVILPGGVRDAAPTKLDQLRTELDDFEREFDQDRRLFLDTASMVDRLVGSGRLTRELVEEYAAVGPLARGSGISVDARHERPYGEYRRLGLRVITAREGDAMARINVRFGEVDESLRILRQVTDHLRRGNGELAVAVPESGSGSAWGWAEAPQGELLIWVEIDGGRIERVHIASPSLRNWALFDHAFPKDVLTDFAFIEHSFGLTPAGADR